MTTLKLSAPASDDLQSTCKKLLYIFRPILLSLMFAGFINSTMGQTQACWEGSNCTSGDFTLDRIYLASDLTGTPLTTSSCSSPGATVNVYLAIKITNNTSSDRNGVFLSGNISSGNTSTAFAHCFSGSLPNMEQVTLVDPTSFQWNCVLR